MNLRKGLKRRGMAAAAMDITPLVDVVFNLLIFLLVSTTFKSQEQAFSIVLPVGDQRTEVTKVRRPTVFVTREGEYLLYEPGGDRHEAVAGTRYLSVEQLSVGLERLAKRSGADAAVNIKGDAAASYQKILDVVNECRRHGLNRVFFPYKVGEREP